MAQKVNQIRRALDAGHDYFGSENVDSAYMTGWTTQFWSFIANAHSNVLAASFYSAQLEDSQGGSPYQDGLSSSNSYSNVQVWYTDVGLRHYHNQMQAMKGFNTTAGDMAGDYSSTSPSVNGIPAVGDGNGTYNTGLDVRMGDMRGFEYPTAGSVIWPSSNIPAGASPYEPGANTPPGGDEYLANAEEISVGSVTDPTP